MPWLKTRVRKGRPGRGLDGQSAAEDDHEQLAATEIEEVAGDGGEELAGVKGRSKISVRLTSTWGMVSSWRWPALRSWAVKGPDRRYIQRSKWRGTWAAGKRGKGGAAPPCGRCRRSRCRSQADAAC